MESIRSALSVNAASFSVTPEEVSWFSEEDRFLEEMENKERSRFDSSLCTETEKRIALIPRLAAHMLLHPDGTLNLGRIPRILSHLLNPQCREDQVDCTIGEFCSLLGCDTATIQNGIEKIDLPPHGSIGERIVQISCGASPDYVPSLYDVRWTVLSALLTSWRQKEGTCFVDAEYLVAHDSHIEHLIADFGDILAKGGLSRSVGRSQALQFFPIAEWPILLHSGLNRAADEILRLFPAIEQGWSILGGTRAEFVSFVDAPSSYSLLGLFERLRQVKGKSTAELHYALNFIEGVGRPLLPVFWTRAVGGMLVPRVPLNEAEQFHLTQYYWHNFFNMVCDTLEAIDDLEMENRLIEPSHDGDGDRLRHHLYDQYQRVEARLVCNSAGDPSLAWFLDSKALQDAEEYSRFCQDCVCDLYRFAGITDGEREDAIRRISISPFEGRGYVLIKQLCSPLSVRTRGSIQSISRHTVFGSQAILLRETPGRAMVQKVLQWAKAAREAPSAQHGIQAWNKNHAFRLLPCHKSILSFDGGNSQLRAFEDAIRRTYELPWTPELLARIGGGIVSQCVSLGADPTDANAILETILDDFDQKLANLKSVREVVQALWESTEALAAKNSILAALIETPGARMQLQLTSSMNAYTIWTMNPDPILYFGDCNYGQPWSATPILYGFWFEPCSGHWSVVCCSRDTIKQDGKSYLVVYPKMESDDRFSEIVVNAL